MSGVTLWSVTFSEQPARPATQPLSLVVLVSGAGTLLQSLIAGQGPDYQISGVVSDKNCPALARAHDAGIGTHIVPLGTDREVWDAELAETVAALRPELIVSAGFMKILGRAFLERFPQQIINTHPALLPAFPGAHAVRDALASGVKITGSTVHFVDEGVDTGAIIAQRPVAVEEDDTEERLHERIKVVERELIVKVIQGIAHRTERARPD